ncbi:hypothetical protein SAY87_020028 [Trapa incisa]|uniref:Uncharacterized protein n=1 Tax=Trapa incisa TaxID=236973 RepID=A0AAN7K3A3_9MYRT|nr:hypothetical protein SAY87_020028 [Trapa incisa]
MGKSGNVLNLRVQKGMIQLSAPCSNNFKQSSSLKSHKAVIPTNVVDANRHFLFIRVNGNISSDESNKQQFHECVLH